MSDRLRRLESVYLQPQSSIPALYDHYGDEIYCGEIYYSYEHFRLLPENLTLFLSEYYGVELNILQSIIEDSGADAGDWAVNIGATKEIAEEENI